MLRRLASVIVASSVLSGCATSPRAKLVGGGALAISGVALGMPRDHDECRGDWKGATDFCNGVDNTLASLLGMGLVVLGVVLAVDGLHDLEEEANARRDDESRLIQSGPPTPVPATPAASSYDAELPAAAVILERVENRLAMQASAIARTGDCSSAIATANELAKRDPDMFGKLLVADPDLAACYPKLGITP
jgi:hypothetical protein